MSELDTPFLLDAHAVEDFSRDGFVKLCGVFSPGVIASYEPEITSKVIELNTQHRPLEERDTYGRAFLQVMNLWRQSAVVREFVFSRRLAQIAAQLLGVNAVRLYHDQALYKEAGGGITPWHADQYYWPIDTDRCVTAWVPLQETPDEMGPLAFARGSHRFSFGRDLEISDESEQVLRQALAEQDFPEVAGPYGLGDASFHLGWTFHRAGLNHSAVPRRVMTIIYVDATSRVTRPANGFQANDLQSWMPGLAVGDLVSSPLNPILYQTLPIEEAGSDSWSKSS